MPAYSQNSRRATRPELWRRFGTVGMRSASLATVSTYAAALRIADAGIAADTASDVAKQASDLMLLDKDLAVVARAVVEGRRTLANTMKYVKITASSNFGNVLSVVAASVFLPFLPMLPIQLMVQNLLYDSAQLALPWDRVDSDYQSAPRRWEARGLVRFMVIFGR